MSTVIQFNEDFQRRYGIAALEMSGGDTLRVLERATKVVQAVKDAYNTDLVAFANSTEHLKEIFGVGAPGLGSLSDKMNEAVPNEPVEVEEPAPVAEKTPAKRTRKAPAKKKAKGPMFNGKTYDPAVVREWARGQGIPVTQRGRLGAGVLEAYFAGHTS
jgi:hypothetical protein